MLTLMSYSTGWQLGIALGIVVIAVAAVIVIVIVLLALQDRQAGEDGRAGGRGRARSRPAELGGIARINDSGVRILHAARSLRKVAVGK